MSGDEERTSRKGRILPGQTEPWLWSLSVLGSPALAFGVGKEWRGSVRDRQGCGNLARSRET